MAPNGRAQKNHDELFPGHVSTLAVTDPARGINFIEPASSPPEFGRQVRLLQQLEGASHDKSGAGAAHRTALDRAVRRSRVSKLPTCSI